MKLTSPTLSAALVLAAGCFASTPLHAEPARNLCEMPRAESFSLLSSRTLLRAPRGALPPAQLSAPTPAASRELLLEIRDSAKGRAPVIQRFTLPVTVGESSKLESRVADASYEISVFDDGLRPLSFDVRREQREPDARWSRAMLRTSVRMKPGQKAVIARIDHADGHRTELTATLR